MLTELRKKKKNLYKFYFNCESPEICRFSPFILAFGTMIFLRYLSLAVSLSGSRSLVLAL